MQVPSPLPVTLDDDARTPNRAPTRARRLQRRPRVQCHPPLHSSRSNAHRDLADRAIIPP